VVAVTGAAYGRGHTPRWSQPSSLPSGSGSASAWTCRSHVRLRSPDSRNLAGSGDASAIVPGLTAFLRVMSLVYPMVGFGLISASFSRGPASAHVPLRSRSCRASCSRPSLSGSLQSNSGSAFPASGGVLPQATLSVRCSGTPGHAGIQQGSGSAGNGRAGINSGRPAPLSRTLTVTCGQSKSQRASLFILIVLVSSVCTTSRSVNRNAAPGPASRKPGPQPRSGRRNA